MKFRTKSPNVVRLAAIIAAMQVTACMKGPAFLKQSGSAPKDAAVIETAPAVTEPTKPAPEAGSPVAIATTTEGEKTKGAVSSASNLTQVVAAAAGSSIAGTQISFPPGALAIDTEISMEPADVQLAVGNTAEILGIQTTFTASSAAVSIQSAVSQDATVPFTVALDLPSEGNGLRLDDGDDPYARVVVVYRVLKAELGREFSGMFSRADLTIENGKVSFDTRYFGTFQAAFTEKLVAEAPKEVETGAEPAPKAKIVRAMMRGPALLSYGEGEPARLQGFQGFGVQLTPWRVQGPKMQISTGMALYVTPGE